jgi:NADPH:quinone reductase-like Zn-dependent oxidoreductase
MAVGWLWRTNRTNRKSRVQVGQPKLPRQKATAGCRTAGIVETVGPDVTAFAVGDAVFGKSNFPGGGSYAEFVTVPATDIVRKPPSIDHAQAAAIPGGALTAWQAMFGDGALELAAGRTLLILGAAGGVGGFAVQLAKWKGARVVAAGRAAQEAHPRALGADLIVDTARGDPSLAGKVDAVLDMSAASFRNARGRSSSAAARLHRR